MTRRAMAALAVLTIGTTSGCTGDEGTTTVRVSAASSLTEAFELTERNYAEQGDPDIHIELNVGGSATLVNQVLEGAPVDIIATADGDAMDRLGDMVLERHPLGRNRIALLRNTSAPSVATIDDLSDPNLLIAACDPSVPCGRLTRQVLAELGAEVPIDTLEASVRLVRERVLSGEVDLGFVYVTDVPEDDARATRILEDDLPDLANEVVIGRLSDSAESERLYAWLVDEVPATLARLGFET